MQLALWSLPHSTLSNYKGAKSCQGLVMSGLVVIQKSSATYWLCKVLHQPD